VNAISFDHLCTCIPSITRILTYCVDYVFVYFTIFSQYKIMTHPCVYFV